MSDAVRGLDALRALHPAAGASIDSSIWLAIFCGLVLSCCLLLAARTNLLEMRALRRAILSALGAVRRMPAEVQLAEQALVLRRLARTLGGEAAATLRGDAWLAALDHWFRTDYFTCGEGRCFVDDLYRRGNSCNPDATLNRLENLARRLRR
jgi:Domain of unknown function (DUF4381)